MSCYSLNLFPDITIDKPREQKGEVNPGYKGTSKGWGGLFDPHQLKILR